MSTVQENISDASHVLMVCLCDPVGDAAASSLGEVHFCDRHGGAIPVHDLVRSKLHLLLHVQADDGRIVPLNVKRTQS